MTEPVRCKPPPPFHPKPQNKTPHIKQKTIKREGSQDQFNRKETDPFPPLSASLRYPVLGLLPLLAYGSHLADARPLPLPIGVVGAVFTARPRGE